MALDNEGAAKMMAQMARLEERMDHVTEKIEGAATHQEKMWDRIDQVVSGLIELKTLFQSQSLEPGVIKSIEKKVDDQNSRIMAIEIKQSSVWEIAKPFFYSILTGAGTLFLAKIVGFIPK